MNDYDELLELISEIQNTLSQLLSSGFLSAHDFTIKELKKLKIYVESYGLKYATENLEFLYSKLENKRHNLEFDYKECIEQFCKLNEYCKICKKFLEIEKAKKQL